ncbi:MAG: hypothetical protein AAB496_02025 [Patescibacteria group bacterium]
MKKIAAILTIIMLFIGISSAKATKITAYQSPETSLADLIIGKWSFIGKTEEGILVKSVTVFEPDGRAEFSITTYNDGLAVFKREISGRYSVGKVDKKRYLFLNFDEGVWVTAEIVSFEPKRMELKEISNSSNTSGVAYAVLWEKIATPTE